MFSTDWPARNGGVELKSSSDVARLFMCFLSAGARGVGAQAARAILPHSLTTGARRGVRGGK